MASVSLDQRTGKHEMHADFAVTRQFLRAALPDPLEGLWLHFWRKPKSPALPSVTLWLPATFSKLIEPLEKFLRVNPQDDFYFGVSFASRMFGHHERLTLGPSDGRLPAGIFALWVDIDIRSPQHANAADRPPDEATALSLLPDLLPPSLIVRSGGGIHAYWFLKEPEIFTGDSPEAVADHRARVASIVSRWQRLIQDLGKAKGFRVDSTMDLTRVMRLPGSVNHKIAAEPRPVEIVVPEVWKTYNLSEFAEVCDGYGVFEPEIMGTDSCGRVELGPLVVNPRVQIDPTCIAEMQANSSWFSDVWNLKKRAPKNSFSEQDIRLANCLAATVGGLTDQQILDWLVVFRREKAMPGHTKPKNLVSYRHTIAKARRFGEAYCDKQADAARAARRKEQREKLDQENERASEDARESPDAARKILLKLWGLEVHDFIDNSGSSHTFELFVTTPNASSPVTVKVPEIKSLTRFPGLRDIIAQDANYYLPDRAAKHL